MRWSEKELNEISKKDFAIAVLEEQYVKVDPLSFKGIKLNQTIHWIALQDRTPTKGGYEVKANGN